MYCDQTILGAVQEGTCAEINAKNPYKVEDKKRYYGWKEGHEGAVKEYKQEKHYDSLPLSRKLICLVGFHDFKLTKLPGRPHINNDTGLIDYRDPIVKKYTCIYCDYSYFIGLDPIRKRPQLKRYKWR